MSVRLIVGDTDLTALASNLEWSNADPGGHEACSFEVPNDVFPLPGDPVTVWAGLTRVWMGRVEEPGDNFDERRAAGQVGAVGAGVVLKDGDASMVFIDRALGRWREASRTRHVALLAANFGPQGFTTRPDTTTGEPVLVTEIRGAWGASGIGLSEAWYDAGADNLIGRLRGTWTRGGANVSGADANWTWDARLRPQDDGSGATDTTGNLRAVGPGTIDLAAAGSRRYAQITQFYNAAAGVAGAIYNINWANVRVIGNHGLTIQGATAAEEGFYAEDIIGWVIDQVPGINRGTLEASEHILQHSAYYIPVPHEQIVADTTTLIGCHHWGVWAPDNLLDDTPVLHFLEPPEDATASVARGECQQVRLAQRLSDFHNQVRVNYTDAAGATASVLVERENPRLPVGLDRTLQHDLGIADATVAEMVGEMVLALEEQQTRAAGSLELPATVATSSGRKPVELLRAGIDRLKIVGLPGAGSWTDADTRRFDVFRIRRTVSRVQAGGAVVTTAEVDAGANLQETLNARLSLAAQLAS